MSRTKKILLGTVAAVGIGAAAFSFSGVGGQAMNTAKLEFIGSAAAAGGHHGWGRHGGRGGHGGLRHICSESRGEKLENAIGFAEAFFSFNSEQKTAWAGLTSALRESSAAIGERCDALKEGERSKSATAKLERVETMLTAGLDVVKKVRPAFDGFYATLTDDQKAALDKLIEHKRHGRR